MRGYWFLTIIAAVLAGACEDELARKAENAAERVQSARNHLRHERRELAVAAAERADDRFEGRDVADHVEDIADEVADVADEAGELAEAQADYEYLKSLRVQSLRAEHSVYESQPMLIHVLASARGLLPSRLRRVHDNLVIFRERLAQTRKLIDELQYVNAAEWERRDDEVGHAMAEMRLARDASWQALEGKIDDGDFPQT